MSDKFYHVGELGETQPEPTQFEAKPFKKGKPPEPLSFEVVMTAEATEKQRKSGTVQVNIPGFSPVKFYCDEDIPVGDDTAGFGDDGDVRKVVVDAHVGFDDDIGPAAG